MYNFTTNLQLYTSKPDPRLEEMRELEESKDIPNLLLFFTMLESRVE
jgi:hypothetical protein